VEQPRGVGEGALSTNRRDYLNGPGRVHMSNALTEGLRVTVFAYGSNMLTARLKERAPSARKISIGQLAGYQLCWNKRSRDRSGKCSVTETGVPKHRVWGVVYQMSGEDKASLDRAEGLGQGYGERVVNVLTRTGKGTAVIYYATSIDPGIRPYDWYRDLVVAGAREHGLPENYVLALEAVSAVKDPDPTREERNRRLLRRM
jgi:gamma-glutamylcyclotransferase